MRFPSQGRYTITQKLDTIDILGVEHKPSKVMFEERVVKDWAHLTATQELIVSRLSGNLNEGGTLTWS